MGIWQFDITTGTSERTAVTDKGGDPAPDPSGQYVAYFYGALKLCELASGETRTLLRFNAYDDGPDEARTLEFSNDGTRILFWSGGFNRGTWEYTLADARLEHVLSNSICASYSPTGDSLVYTPQTGDTPEGLGLLWILDRNTGEKWQLTTKYP